MNDSGITATLIGACFGVLVWLSIVIGIVFVAVHFIHKFW